MKKCIKCNINQSLEDFPKSSSSRDGRHSYCKKCMVQQRMNKYEYKRKRMTTTLTHKQCRLCEEVLPLNKYSDLNKTYCKECSSFLGHKRVLARYRLTVDEYVNMLKEQNYVCKICGGKEDKRLSVDHDHSCCPGKETCGNCIRGLLCSYCNKTLGMAKDDPKILKKMIQYLESFK
jgi:hypothetical protein